MSGSLGDMLTLALWDGIVVPSGCPIQAVFFRSVRPESGGSGEGEHRSITRGAGPGG